MCIRDREINIDAPRAFIKLVKPEYFWDSVKENTLSWSPSWGEILGLFFKLGYKKSKAFIERFGKNWDKVIKNSLDGVEYLFKEFAKRGEEEFLPKEIIESLSSEEHSFVVFMEFIEAVDSYKEWENNWYEKNPDRELTEIEKERKKLEPVSYTHLTLPTN